MWQLLLSVCCAAALAACGQQPYRVFAVQVAWAPKIEKPGLSGPPPSAAAPVQARLAKTDVGALTPKHPQWDLNQASAATLSNLPGMDEATLQAMLAGRPYKSKRELVRRRILTAAQYASWKGYLVVHRMRLKPTRTRGFGVRGSLGGNRAFSGA